MNTNFSLPRTRFIIFISVAAIAGLIIGIVAAKQLIMNFSYDFNSYQAVFLSNNQVYFGKLSGLNSQYPILSDVYYIQALMPQDLSGITKTKNKLQLVKLGSELHQPQNIMYVNRDQILFIEPLKPDSNIVKSILEFKKNQTP